MTRFWFWRAEESWDRSLQCYKSLCWNPSYNKLKNSLRFISRYGYFLLVSNIGECCTDLSGDFCSMKSSFEIQRFIQNAISRYFNWLDRFELFNQRYFERRRTTGLQNQLKDKCQKSVSGMHHATNISTSLEEFFISQTAITQKDRTPILVLGAKFRTWFEPLLGK